MKKHIPNLITLLNLISGSIAVVLALQGHMLYAVLLAGLAAFFDFLDGFAARLLNARSPIGLQLDSLADVISFGLLPSVVVYILLSSHPALQASTFRIVPYLAFIIAAASAYRLAKFNIDTRQTNHFLGLATPANAAFILPLGLISGPYAIQDAPLLTNLASTLPFLLLLIPVSAWLLTSEIPMFALKFGNDTRKMDIVRVAFVATALILILFLGFAGVSLSIIVYLSASLILRFLKFF